ncbi:hypothetical protein [Photobacterium chitinilyticum]|uniref:Lipoprotein n=1 Tax=Photobacterium chitinilyticum TaxID=2485123 RepID=A0A444JV34_9GAMM|nr:hypothetical protein [Photobacterium chitinilyticum]RWX56858.1 hypothetical protein EDI28_02090 [Photobacterium chitinilyticum]
MAFKTQLSALFIAVSTIVATGCNDSSTTSTATEQATSSAPKLNSYTFIDEPVKGLYFKSDNNSGCTDANGTYSVKEGDSVSFYLGKCDEANKPSLSDTNLINIGFISQPSSITTPYDLKISNVNNSVDPITTATILKSFNRSSATNTLDLSGLKFNNNGENVVNEIQTLINDPTKDRSTVLKKELLDKVKLANRDSNMAFEHDDFIPEATVQSELESTLEKVSVATAFTASDLSDKHLILADDLVLYLGQKFSETTTGSYSVQGKGEAFAKSDDESGTVQTWGVLSKPFGTDGDKGKAGHLYLMFGPAGRTNNFTVNPVNISGNEWTVLVNDLGTPPKTKMEKIVTGVKLDNLASLNGKYKSKLSAEFDYKFEITVDGSSLTIKQPNGKGDKGVGSIITDQTINTASVSLDKPYLKLDGEVLDFTIIPTKSDASEIVLMHTNIDNNTSLVGYLIKE